MSITLKEISKKTGVTASTVSLILNNKRTSFPISQKTRQKVLTTAQNLNYKPNILARRLLLKKSFTIGFIASDIEDIFYGPIISGCEEKIINSGYHLFVMDAKDDGKIETECIRSLLERKTDGILIAGVPQNVSEKGIEEIKQANIPCVLIGRQLDKISCVVVDNEKGGFMATEYLIKNGRKKISFLMGPKELPDNIKRLSGYKNALSKYGIKFDKQLIGQANHIPKSGYIAMKKLLEKTADIDSCFAYNDLVSIGAIKEKGLKIPQDFSIIGFDDTFISSYTEPALTTIKQPLKQMGKKGAQLLLKIITNKDLYQKIVLDPKLVIRGTT